MTTQQNLPEKAKKDVFDAVFEKLKSISHEELRLPKDYHPGNAVKTAALIIEQMTVKDGRPVLQACTRESIAKSLLKMAMHGLDPMLNQCYFIVYDDRLELQRSYFGTMSLARRIAKLKTAYAEVIYEGDEFEYHIDTATGKKVLEKHVQKLGNISVDSGKIKGAYAVLHFEDGATFTEVMTMAQIRMAWEQGYAKGNSPAHKRFPDQMAKKTVIQRALKPFLSSSIEGYEDETDNPHDLDPKMEVKTDRPVISMDEISMVDGPGSETPYVGDQIKKEKPVNKPIQDKEPSKGQSGMFDDNGHDDNQYEDGPGF